MAMGWVGAGALDGQDEADAVAELRVNRRHLRDTQDPFALPEVQFRDLFRISRDLAWDLVNELRPFLERERCGLSVECQVEDSQRAVGQDFMVALSQTAVSRCLKSVTDLLHNRLFREWVKFPATPGEREAARAKFRVAPQPFAGAIGAIDCTHVAIIAPKIDEVAYVNHHGYHSLNVQMVCDPDLRILNVNATFPGSRHDAAVWMQSPVRTLMELAYVDGERGTWLLEPWLVTPILNVHAGTPEFAYTTAHCKARSVIERCYGVLKSVWRCLLQERVLMYEPELATKIVNACATLYNMRLHYRLDHEVAVNVMDRMPAQGAAAEPLEARERLAEARRIRNGIVRNHFAR